MALQQRNDELVSLLRADFVYRLDALWAYGPQVKTSVASGDTLLVLAGYQYIVANGFTLGGTVDIYGELVII